MANERDSLQLRLYSRTQEVAGIANALSSCYVSSFEKDNKRPHPYPWMSSFPDPQKSPFTEGRDH